MPAFAYHEGRITIDFGMTEHGHMELHTTVQCPESDVDGDLPHRMLVEGALSMARESLDEVYAGGGDDDH